MVELGVREALFGGELFSATPQVALSYGRAAEMGIVGSCLVSRKESEIPSPTTVLRLALETNQPTALRPRNGRVRIGGG